MNASIFVLLAGVEKSSDSILLIADVTNSGESLETVLSSPRAMSALYLL
jgi:hypoxanthine phosphoribosyltransferase